jgi:hypothetical protein
VQNSIKTLALIACKIKDGGKEKKYNRQFYDKKHEEISMNSFNI